MLKLSQLFAPVYYDFWKSKNTHQILKGGRSSAKGDSAYTKCVLNALQQPTDVFVYTPTSIGTADGVFSQVKKVCDRIGVPYEPKQSPLKILFSNGSRISFKSLDAVNQSKSSDFFKGVEAQHNNVFIVFDEVAALKDFSRVESIQNTYLTRNMSNVQFIYVFNPPKNKRHPIFDFVGRMEKRNSLILHTTIFDLPEDWFSPLVWEQIARDKEINEADYRHQWLGEATGTEGLFFPNYDRDKVTLNENSYFNPVYSVIGIDYGEQNATTFVHWVFTAKGSWVRERLWYYSGRENKRELGVEKYSEEFSKWYNDIVNEIRRPDYVVCDPSAKALMIAIRNRGIDIFKGNNKREYGWSIVKKHINAGRFYQKGTQDKANAEYEFAIYSNDFKEDCVKENDHIMDADRLALVKGENYLREIYFYERKNSN